jgi:hypothetical protein
MGYASHDGTVGGIQWANVQNKPAMYNQAYRAINAIRTLDATDYQIECTANSFTITLPTAVGITGRVYSIKNTGSGTITIACNGAQTIDGHATQSLSQWDNITLMSNNTNWIII